jgi:Malate/L-lactate dehydrogenases
MTAGTDAVTGTGRVAWSAATEWVAAVLAANGMSSAHAEEVAWGLTEAQASGIYSHGLMRTIDYVSSLRAGDINPAPRIDVVSETATSLHLEADGGYGFGPMRRLVDALIDKAAEHPIVMGGVRNSHHFGPASLYALRAAHAGYGAIVITNASANLAAPSGVRPVIGNNPIAVAVPGSATSGPVCADIAMSHVALGKIRLAAKVGKPIPLGWARDASGLPTEDAQAGLDAGMLEPLGGHKGFALATLIELIAGAATGSPFGKDSTAHTNPRGGVGHFAIVFDLRAFIAADDFAVAVDTLAAQLSDAAVPGRPQVLPGEPERVARSESERLGLVVPGDIGTLLARLGESSGVPFPEVARA